MKELAPDYKVVYKSANPNTDYGFTNCIHILPSGRYVTSYDISDKFGKICISDDKGETWRITCEEDFFHGSLFEAGESLYSSHRQSRTAIICLFRARMMTARAGQSRAFLPRAAAGCTALLMRGIRTGTSISLWINS